MVELLPSLAEMLHDAAVALTSAGVDDARREVNRIWLDVGTGSVALDGNAVVAPEIAAAFVGAIKRRAAGEPLAYATGMAGFRHLDLRVDRRVLIPRPETEGLVDLALGKVNHGTAVDVGTGSGAIALSLAQEGNFSQVIGVDRSADALVVARDNGVRTGISVDWREGDLLHPIAPGSVDLIVSNPPYLTQLEHDTLAPAVRDYEPAMALVGGPDGMDFYRRLLADGMSVLRGDGWIALEIDCSRAAQTIAVAGECSWKNIEVRDDLFGRARYLLAQRGSAS